MPEIFSKIIVCGLPLPNCRQQLFLSFWKPHDFLFCHLRRSSLDFSCRLLSPLLCKYDVYYVPETWFSSSKLSPDIHRASRKKWCFLWSPKNAHSPSHNKICQSMWSLSAFRKKWMAISHCLWLKAVVGIRCPMPRSADLPRPLLSFNTAFRTVKSSPQQEPWLKLGGK